MMKIKIGKEEQYKIKIERGEEFSESFFHLNYEKALENISEIVENNKAYHRDINNNNDLFESNSKEGKNNIIAFCGERGAGKTSVMVSVAKALKDHRKSEWEIFKKNSELNNLTKCKFWVIDMIDPSTFEAKESVFPVILAKLFNEFKELIKQDCQGADLDNQRKIIRLFKGVFENYKQIISGGISVDNSDYGETLEALSNLAAGSNMRKNFIELIQALLLYKFGKDDLDKSFIVFSIDDIDMCFNKAYEMAEQIRKYLVIPNVINLLAIKIEQLNNSIEQAFVSEYSTLLKYEKLVNEEKQMEQTFEYEYTSNATLIRRKEGICVDKRLEEEPKIMATRYIEKLIPNGKKIYLSSFLSFEEIEKVQLVLDEQEEKTKIKEDVTLQKQILNLIYKKTGLIFVDCKNNLHLLVPDNMRELQNFLAMILNLEDVNMQELDKNKEVLEKNIDTFDKYFTNVWIPRHLTQENIKVIQEYRRLSPNKKNKYIISNLYKTIKKQIDDVDNNRNYQYMQKNLHKSAGDVSLGDVIDVLIESSKESYKDEDLFIFAIKALYSIELFKYIFVNSNLKGVQQLIAGNVLGSSEKVLIRRDIEGKSRAKTIFDNYQNLKIEFKVKSASEKIEQQNEYIFSSTIGKAISLVRKLVNEDKTLSILELRKEYEVEIQPMDKKEIQEEVVCQFNCEEVCKQALEVLCLVHCFIYPQRNKLDVKSKDPEIIVDEMKFNDSPIVSRGIIDTRQAVFSVAGFFNRCLNPYALIGIILGEQNTNIKWIHTLNIVKWFEKYKTAFPVYSMELIIQLANDEKIRWRKEAVDEEKELYNFICNLLKNLNRFLDEREFDFPNLKEAFLEFPLIRKGVFDEQNSEKYKWVVNLLQDILQKREGDNKENSTTTESKDAMDEKIRTLIMLRDRISKYNAGKTWERAKKEVEDFFALVIEKDKHNTAYLSYRAIEGSWLEHVTEDMKMDSDLREYLAYITNKAYDELVRKGLI